MSTYRISNIRTYDIIFVVHGLIFSNIKSVQLVIFLLTPFTNCVIWMDLLQTAQKVSRLNLKGAKAIYYMFNYFSIITYAQYHRNNCAVEAQLIKFWRSKLRIKDSHSLDLQSMVRKAHGPHVHKLSHPMKTKKCW